jgi:hypothetical protein
LAATLTTVVAALGVSAASASADDIPIDGVNHGLQAIATHEAHTIGSLIGVRLTRLHMAVGWAKHAGEVPNGKTETLKSVNGPGDENGSVCQIALNKGWLGPLPAEEKDEVIAHEVFHCFEREITPEENTDGEWITEGMARWVDLSLFPHTHLADALKALTEYFQTPRRSLFVRKYDAVGFWAHAQDVVPGGLWKRIPAIVRAGVHDRNEAAVAAAVGSDEGAFLASWGSSAFDLSDGSPPTWRPGSPLERYWPATVAPTVISAAGGASLKPFTTAQLKIVPAAAEPLIEIHFDPDVHGTFGVDDGYSDGAVTGKLFCSATNASECQCPAGYTGTVPTTTPLPSEPLLGVADGQTSGSVSVTYLAPKTSGYCQPEARTSVSSCGTLLPGFSDEISQQLEQVIGKAGGAEETTGTNGYSTYSCPLEYEGGLASVKGEEVFRGVLAVLVVVEDWPTDAGAAGEQKLRTAALAGSLPNGTELDTTGIGDEAYVVATPVETSQNGEAGCGSLAGVRVDNVDVSYGLIGTDSEAGGPYIDAACGAGAVELLREVAAGL